MKKEFFSVGLVLRGKIHEKRIESLGKGTFVREFARGGSTGKSARHKHFVRGYTPGTKTRGSTPGIWPSFFPVITPDKIPHFFLQLTH
ncbi:hypothetical protein MTR_6g056040 [Medicago truncatula]|uniref:Uncharacterized protein n=1 Tax=Medicago truncatula TaxID=3880 RepID=A0A072UKT0_MEDTR|nr:hypothetical protein MTR_6g056040 [Medicago truncatula]